MDFNEFNVKLTEHLWHLDTENETGFFSFEDSYDTGMHFSAMEGNLDDIEFYLNHLNYEKNPRTKIEGADMGCTPMHISAKYGHLEAVQMIKNSIDVTNPADDKGNTVLHYAAENGHLEVVQELMEDLEEKNPAAFNEESLTPMHLAAANGHLSVVQEIKKESGLMNPSNAKGWSVLHSAASHGQLAIVEEICMDLDEKNPMGDLMTPLHQASKDGHLETIQFFHKILSDISVADSNRMNSLHHAAKEGHILLVDFLIDFIPIGTKDKNCKTAKDLAAFNDHEDVVTYLQDLDRLSDETREQGATRRLEKLDGRKYEMMISKIKDEIEKELPTTVKNTCQSLFSGSEWPSNIIPCLDFNKGSCEKTILHDEDFIHSCGICKLMFGTPFFHPAKSCEILRKLDSGKITAKLDKTQLDSVDVGIVSAKSGKMPGK